ncbi:hypothetical protein MUB15_31965 [Priestia sp. OVS21]|nr:hypothetical protein [Priestia sp. OVS21]MCJ7992709.1 hypothetical protein [Priestia sp. OVS21]
MSGIDKPLEDLVSISVQSFKETIFAYKRKRIKNTFTAYFFGTLRGQFTIERRREVQRNSDSVLFYNVLKA